MKYIITEGRLKQMMGGVITEESESKKDSIKSMLKKLGLDATSKLMGGIDYLIRVLYDGDIMKFSEDTHTPLVYMSVDKKSLYLHEALVENLELNDNTRLQHRGEKELGDFKFEAKDNLMYKFTARLYPTQLHNQTYYKVVGLSGDSGFGYGFISKKNTLGLRHRQQIFKQIIDKYGLEPYMKLKTFY